MKNRIITISFHPIVDNIISKSSPSPVGVRRRRVGRFYKEVGYDNIRKHSGEFWLWSEISGTARVCSLETEKPLFWDNFSGGVQLLRNVVLFFGSYKQLTP